MTAVPNVHVRDLPSEALEILREAAERRGRSLNAELIAALTEAAERERSVHRVRTSLEQARRAWEGRNPNGYPPGLEPETIIREARDSR